MTELIMLKGKVEYFETPYGKKQKLEVLDYTDKLLKEMDEMTKYMEEKVFKDDLYKNVRLTCKNLNENCVYWKVLGECDKNFGYMSGQCAPACRRCEILDEKLRCPRDESIPKHLAEAGDLHKIFERLTTNADVVEKYQPKILSMPSPTHVDASDIVQGPWVVEMPHFLTDEECEHMIKVGHELGFYDSANYTLARNATTRTSQQTWCKKSCASDPIMMGIDAKISDMSTVPVNNSEYMQILKYEVGEYYHTHNDYNPRHLEKQSGVRIFTVYLYLNSVEEGGGTNFPGLNITVKPEKGKAVIWPSVLNEDPNKEDNRTNHQALPVVKGRKYGANVWQHQRDTRWPSDLGCIS
eukprot:CAMPEP_0178907042 /NCGR_PEP_ID=MMETSP0786-20121207/7150_1 /TAXON_ID=186022 /ORGANISM="Thalassionema frauenfeldii, Strain CCMP 1798" /LENGTH=352 /DNA_ID=CAMNT_0020578795 /DNA_START=194 /DNA_END=1252 /DNA_ORIENTATION=-